MYMTLYYMYMYMYDVHVHVHVRTCSLIFNRPAKTATAVTTIITATIATTTAKTAAKPFIFVRHAQASHFKLQNDHHFPNDLDHIASNSPDIVCISLLVM